MTTIEEIKEIKACGMSYTALMIKLNLSKFAFDRRMEGKVQFREKEAEEVKRIYEILKQI